MREFEDKDIPLKANPETLEIECEVDEAVITGFTVKNNKVYASVLNDLDEPMEMYTDEDEDVAFHDEDYIRRYVNHNDDDRVKDLVELIGD